MTHPFIQHLREQGFNLNVWCDARPAFIAESWCRTDLPPYAAVLLESEETLIPETGETSVSQLWLCAADEDSHDYIGYLHDEWKGV